ncbi:hypothetical protein SDJN02_24647 [Cucurbita argyrosperma subsp. argyrosperma]|nr:hypothetical protein SDJN02_24647 [Cucurbita argyrosperma subsp. argyrosperma]
MDENLKIQRFEVPPSASNFEFLIESRDVPAVLVGGVMDWRSLSEWISYNGGLGNLQVVFQRSRYQGVQCLSQLLEGGDLREKELREETYSHRLITIVHDHISSSDQIKHLQSSSTKGSADEVERMEMTSLQSLENDQIATFIWNLEPCILQKFLLTTAVISFDFPITFTSLSSYPTFFSIYNDFPRTLEALILHLPSPVGAEVLTRKFD